MKFFQYYDENHTVRLGFCRGELLADAQASVQKSDAEIPTTLTDVLHHADQKTVLEAYQTIEPVAISGEISFAPAGPFLVPADALDADHLHISCRVNGELRQDSNTSNMIFSCAEIVSYLSQYMTLKPGDMIYSGTPDGVILGMPDDRKKWLTHGDTIEVTIEGIGTLKNTIA